LSITQIEKNIAIIDNIPYSMIFLESIFGENIFGINADGMWYRKKACHTF
jgi:hypothetical protein